MAAVFLSRAKDLPGDAAGNATVIGSNSKGSCAITGSVFNQNWSIVFAKFSDMPSNSWIGFVKTRTQAEDFPIRGGFRTLKQLAFKPLGSVVVGQ